MKRDLRRQTFSKPVKPVDDDEIKRLTSDVSDISQPSIQETNTEKKVSAKSENPSPKRKAASIADVKAENSREAMNEEKVNPFLLVRGQTSEIGVEKTGYRLRSDYMDLLKLVKRMKKGYTLEAVLDDALTFYFENSEDGRKAVKHRQLLDSE